MKPFKLLVDTNCDLPYEFIVKNNIPYLGIMCNFKGNTYADDFGQTLKFKTFYDEVKKGEVPSTSQVNAFRFEEAFKKCLSEGYAVLYIACSSALSGTYDSSIIAKNTILETIPDADITIIDSKSVSMGEGLLVYYAYEMMKSGASVKEIAHWVENNKLRLNHWFTVDDLKHLKRSGRVSATSATIGTILEIKPILHVNDEGRLVTASKVKGRKKSIKTLAEKLVEKIISPEEQVIAISHADCLEDAVHLETLIRNSVNVKDVIISNIGPGVGSHCGPGTVALFFLGENRNL